MSERKHGGDPSACCGIGRALGEDRVARAGAVAISIVRADRPSSIIREKERGDLAKKNAATAARTSSQPAARAGRSGARAGAVPWQVLLTIGIGTAAYLSLTKVTKTFVQKNTP